MIYYKRTLPHMHVPGGEYFITFRLAGSLPIHAIQELRERRKKFLRESSKNSKIKDKPYFHITSNIFKRYENLLDGNTTGPLWLGISEIAEFVKESIHFRDGSDYDLYAYCIMSNHVHIVFRHLDDNHSRFDPGDLSPITKILRNLKSYTALQANRKLNRTGEFWKPESYDRLIRNGSDLENIILYTLNNPVKAGLVDHWEDWPHSYCKPEFLEWLGE